MMQLKQLIWGLAIVAMVACTGKQQETAGEPTTLSGLKKSSFQSEVKGDSTDLYVLKNANGMEVTLTNYGARIVSVMVPDRENCRRGARV